MRIVAKVIRRSYNPDKEWEEVSKLVIPLEALPRVGNSIRIYNDRLELLDQHVPVLHVDIDYRRYQETGEVHDIKAEIQVA